MITAIAVVSILLAACVLYLVGRAILGVFLQYRGTRVVTCPETERAAGVHVDLRRATQAALRGSTEIRLDSCTRWPEKQHCGQECLKQIQQSPADCLMVNIVTRWYQGKNCASCGKSIGEIHWADHKPGLLSPAKQLVEWSRLAPETLPDVLATHQPVCWNCMIVQGMIVQHPGLVLDRARKI